METNISPSLSASSPLDKKIKTELICDVLSLAGIVPDCRDTPYSKHEIRSLGNIQNTKISELDEEIIADYNEEFGRKGKFQRIFPRQGTIDYYSQFIQIPRHNNTILWNYIKETPIEYTTSS